MLYFDRIGVSEGTDVNITSALKECDICHYWYFLKKVLGFNEMSAIYAMIYQGCLWTLVILLI